MIGVVGNKLTLQVVPGYPVMQLKSFNTKQERLDIAHELIAAARLIVQNDFATVEDMIEALQDMVEEE